MCHAPQYGRWDPMLKRNVELELNASQRYDCDNCGWSRCTDDSIPMFCPECQCPLSMFYVGPIEHRMCGNQ